MGSYRDGLLKPAPGCQRAVTEAVALLEKKGYIVVPIHGPDIHKVVQSMCKVDTFTPIIEFDCFLGSQVVQWDSSE